MKYTTEFHDFIQACLLRYGQTPNEYKHHVIVQFEDKYGCSYFSGKWFVLAPYEMYTIEEYVGLGQLLTEATKNYELPEEPEKIEFVPGDTIRMIQEAKSAGKIDLEGKLEKGPLDWKGIK